MRFAREVDEAAVALDHLNAGSGRDRLVAVTPLAADHPIAAVLGDVDPVVRVAHGAVRSAAHNSEGRVCARGVEPVDDALVDRDENDFALGRDDRSFAEACTPGDYAHAMCGHAGATVVRVADCGPVDHCGAVTASRTGSAVVPNTLRIIASVE